MTTRADQFSAELIQKALAEGLPPMPPNRIKEPCGECHLQPGETCDICGATRPADIVPTIAKALCRHTTRAAACACGDDPVVCFAMQIWGDQAVAVARDLKRRGLLR